MTKTREAVEAEALEAAYIAFTDFDHCCPVALESAVRKHIAALWQPIGDGSGVPIGDVAILLWSEIMPLEASVVRGSRYHEVRSYRGEHHQRHLFDHMTHWRYFERPAAEAEKHVDRRENG